MEEMDGQSSTDIASPYSDRPIALNSTTTARDHSGSSSIFPLSVEQQRHTTSPPQMSSLQVTASTHIHQSSESADSIRNNVQGSTVDIPVGAEPLAVPKNTVEINAVKLNSESTEKTTLAHSNPTGPTSTATALPSNPFTRTNSNSTTVLTTHTVEPFTPTNLMMAENRDTTTPLQPSEQLRAHSFLSSAGLAVPMNPVIRQNSSKPLLTPTKFLDGSISTSTYLEHVEKGLKEKEKTVQILEQQLRLAKEEAKEALSRSVHGTEERGKMRQLITDQQDHIDQLDGALKTERAQLEQRTKEFEEELRAHAKSLEEKQVEVQEMGNKMRQLEEQMALHREELEKVKPLQEEYLKVKEALEEMNEIRDAEHRHYDQIVREVVKEKREHQRAAVEALREKQKTEDKQRLHQSSSQDSNKERKREEKEGRKSSKTGKHSADFLATSENSSSSKDNSSDGRKKKKHHKKHHKVKKGGHKRSSSSSNDSGDDYHRNRYEKRHKRSHHRRKERSHWRRKRDYAHQDDPYNDDDVEEEEEEEEEVVVDYGNNPSSWQAGLAGGISGVVGPGGVPPQAPTAIMPSSSHTTLPSVSPPGRHYKAEGYSPYPTMGGMAPSHGHYPPQHTLAWASGYAPASMLPSASPPGVPFLPSVFPAAAPCNRRHLSSSSSSSSSSSTNSEASDALLLAMQKQKYQQQLQEKARESKQALLQRQLQLEFVQKAAELEAKDHAYRVAEAKKALLDARNQLLEVQRMRKEEELRGKKMLSDVAVRHAESRFALEKQEEQLRNARFQWRLSQARAQRESDLAEDQKQYELDSALGKYTRELSHAHQEITIQQKQGQRLHLQAERRLHLTKEELKRHDEQSEYLLQRLREATARRKQNSAVWGTQLQQVLDRSKRENEEILHALHHESKEVDSLI